MKRAIFNKYVDEICSEINMLRDSLFLKDRTTKYSNARFILYNVCYNRPMTIMQIVEYMDDNGYKTTRQSVEHGIQKIYETKDPDVQDFINHLTRKVK
jgi:hypothetical protein